MMNRCVALALALVCLNAAAAGQRSNLAGIKICIDPGHGGKNSNDRHMVPDSGVDFYESESNFVKAVWLKSLLESQGASVLLTRLSNEGTTYPENTSDPDEPSLAARVAFANANNVDWFHSIHSNAIGNGFQSTTSVNYTLVLVREKRSVTDPASGTGNGMGIPQDTGSWTMANIIGPSIRSHNRTTSSTSYLDWTFYGGVNGGFSLGVLRGLLMPGELSEGSFHDYRPETRRLMNTTYRKMEAYALRDAFLKYYGAASDSLGMIAGIQTNIADSAPLNSTLVRLLPENLVYQGDGFTNGYFLLDSLQAGLHTLRFETPGFTPDTVQVNLSKGQWLFIDRTLEIASPPRLVASSPLPNATGIHPGTTISLVFNKRVQRSIAESNIYLLDPAGGRMQGTFTWSNNDAACIFKPTALLLMDTTYHVVISAQVKDYANQLFDGNGDGLGGDSLVFPFRTRFADVIPPTVVTFYPQADSVRPSSNTLINITFSEPLNPTSVSLTNFAMAGPTGGSRTLGYSRVGSLCGVNIYPTGGLVPAGVYRVRASGVSDTAGNVLATTLVWQFDVATDAYPATTIESFDSALAYWNTPGIGPDTVGLDSVAVERSSFTTPVVGGSTGSALVRYTWNPSATDWLLDERLGSGVAKSVTWKKNATRLQAYVHGDGSRTLFRFVVEDSVDAFPAGRPQNREVSTWKRIDWVGWRLLEWDFARDSVGRWVGNGLLEGMMRFAGFQLKYVPGSSLKSGQIVVDQIQLGVAVPTGIQVQGVKPPLEFRLSQNFPNPFNPTTIVRYDVPKMSHVRILMYNILGQRVRILVDGVQEAGAHSVTFDASDLPSGIYLCRMEAGTFASIIKMAFVR